MKFYPRRLAVVLLVLAVAGLFGWRALVQQPPAPPAAPVAEVDVTPIPIAYDQPTVETCQNDQECGPGFFCRDQLCTQVLYDTACTKDADCELIDSAHGFGCCYEGACDIPDLSSESWIAVNKTSRQTDREEFCPAKSACGPAPLCAEHQGDRSEWQAVCLKNTCFKQAR